MPLVNPNSQAHRALERLAQGPARNRDIAAIIDRDSVFVRKRLHEMARRGLVIMVQRRLGRGNPCAIYEITEAGRAELKRLGPAERVWREAA
jgi:predicted ArsR family transcriptional regulator